MTRPALLLLVLAGVIVAHRARVRARPGYRRTLEANKVTGKPRSVADSTTTAPEWFDVDAPLPAGWWRAIDAAPALRVYEDSVDSDNPDDWSEEREYELMRGLSRSGGSIESLPWSMYSARLDKYGVGLGAGRNYHRGVEMRAYRTELRAAVLNSRRRGAA